MSGTFNTVRIRFEKTGRAKYISHLDVNRTMTRALRRAHIPLWYTEGFNRHPYITFAAPLSLGFESVCERMDLRLEEPMEMEVLCEKLNAVMPEGLRVADAAPAVHKAGDLGFARYRLTFSCTKAVLETFLRQPSITALKKSKKGVWKEVDLKAALSDIEIGGEEEAELLVTLPCGSSDTVNPTLLCEALQAFCGQPTTCRVMRIELYALDKTVFA
ncbi:MAG: DUF2344 domain-containing protein [Clostridia bacterium]|nr:DUF2344 domain-containing protein [Clostridia bacterium]